MKNRPARVRELIQRELGALIAREMTFDAKLVTVQAVDLTADFKHCHVHVGVLGTNANSATPSHKLAERRPLLQHELSKRVSSSSRPQLHFHLDESIERGTKVMEIMRQIDEVTPPNRRRPPRARTDAFADRQHRRTLDRLRRKPTPEVRGGNRDDAAPAVRDAEKSRKPRSLRDTKGREASRHA